VVNYLVACKKIIYSEKTTKLETIFTSFDATTVFPHIRHASIIFLWLAFHSKVTVYKVEGHST
jgi:hypothetical protein